MRLRGSKMSKIIEVEQQWKPRRNRRNRKWREGQRKMQGLSTKIIKLLEEDDLNGRNSPCSVVSFCLSLDNRIEDTHGNSEWIRTAHIKNPAINEQDRRSPLFTGRMLRRNDFLDDIGGCDSRQGLSYEFLSEVGRNPNTSQFCLHERLGPSQVCIEPPRLESPVSDIHHHLGSSDINAQPGRNQEAPMIIRSGESMGIAVPLEQLALHQNQEGNEEPSSHQNPRLIRDEYDVYNDDRFSRNGFSPVESPHCFRRSLYYPPGYASPPNESTARRQRPQWPWLNTSVDCCDNLLGSTHHYMRRDRVDYNLGRFGRDTFLPPHQMSYEQSEYNRRGYFDNSGSSLRESRSEISSSHQVNNYSDYRPEAYEINYNNRRDDGRFDWSFSRVESYGSSFSPRRFYSSQPSPYSSSSFSHPAHGAAMDNPRYKSLMESPSSNWEDPPGRNYHYSYQDRISDEDFTDSDQLDSEIEECDDTPKKQVQKLWKKLVKERGILVSREGASAAMTRECADYVKNILLEKASDSTQFHENWKPRFLRTGLVHRTGLYQIICKDRQTVMWTLKQEIPPLEGNGFKMLKRPYDWDCGPVRISMWLAIEPANPQEALQGLDVENPGMGATNWRVVSVSFEYGWRRLIVDVSRESAIYLESNGWTIVYWNNLIPVIRLRSASKQLFFNQLAGDNP